MILFSQNTPFQYFLLFLGLAIFGYFTLRYFRSQKGAAAALQQLGQKPGYRWDPETELVRGEINGQPFSLGQVVERQYGSPSKFVKLALAVPLSPHIEVGVKTKIGYPVVHTIWNKEPFFKVGRLALWTKDEARTAALLQAGLAAVLEKYSEAHFQLHLEGVTLIVTSAHTMETWHEEDLEKALEFARDVSDVLHRAA